MDNTQYLQQFNLNIFNPLNEYFKNFDQFVRKKGDDIQQNNSDQKIQITSDDIIQIKNSFCSEGNIINNDKWTYYLRLFAKNLTFYDRFLCHYTDLDLIKEKFYKAFNEFKNIVENPLEGENIKYNTLGLGSITGHYRYNLQEVLNIYNNKVNEQTRPDLELKENKFKDTQTFTSNELNNVFYKLANDNFNLPYSTTKNSNIVELLYLSYNELVENNIDVRYFNIFFEFLPTDVDTSNVPNVWRLNIKKNWDGIPIIYDYFTQEDAEIIKKTFDDCTSQILQNLIKKYNKNDKYLLEGFKRENPLCIEEKEVEQEEQQKLTDEQASLAARLLEEKDKEAEKRQNALNEIKKKWDDFSNENETKYFLENKNKILNHQFDSNLDNEKSKIVQNVNTIYKSYERSRIKINNSSQDKDFKKYTDLIGNLGLIIFEINGKIKNLYLKNEMIKEIQKLINNYESLFINNEKIQIGGGPLEDYNEKIKKIIDDLELLIKNVVNEKSDQLNGIKNNITEISNQLKENQEKKKVIQSAEKEEKRRQKQEEAARKAAEEEAARKAAEEERQNKILDEAFAEQAEQEKQRQEEEEAEKQAEKQAELERLDNEEEANLSSEAESEDKDLKNEIVKIRRESEKDNKKIKEYIYPEALLNVSKYVPQPRNSILTLEDAVKLGYINKLGPLGALLLLSQGMLTVENQSFTGGALQEGSNIGYHTYNQKINNIFDTLISKVDKNKLDKKVKKEIKRKLDNIKQKEENVYKLLLKIGSKIEESSQKEITWDELMLNKKFNNLMKKLKKRKREFERNDNLEIIDMYKKLSN